MTHQYKQMQREFQDELDELNSNISLRDDELSIFMRLLREEQRDNSADPAGAGGEAQEQGGLDQRAEKKNRGDVGRVRQDAEGDFGKDAGAHQPGSMGQRQRSPDDQQAQGHELDVMIFTIYHIDQ